MKTACIHQPVYYPWLGTVQKIDFAGRYIAYDDCLASKPSWMNRVYIVMNGSKHWLTVPILFKTSDNLLVRDVKLNTSVNWEVKHAKTIHQYYSKAPHFDDVQELIIPLHGKRHTYLVDLNLTTMQHVFDLLDMDVQIRNSSDLEYDRSGQSIRLARMVAATGADVYINGMGADGYLETAPFKRMDIGVYTQHLPAQEYTPFNAPEFLPGLSIIDVVANLGLGGVKELLARNKKANTKRLEETFLGASV